MLPYPFATLSRLPVSTGGEVVAEFFLGFAELCGDIVRSEDVR
jgi:hypothetical protein